MSEGTLSMDFNDVPDKFVPVEPGRCQLEISEVPTLEPTKSGDSSKIVVNFKVISHEAGDKNVGRGVNDHISIKMKTRIKRLLIATGFGTWNAETESYDVPKEIDFADMLGKQCTALLKPDTYKVAGEDEPRVVTRISDYLFDVPTA